MYVLLLIVNSCNPVNCDHKGKQRVHTVADAHTALCITLAKVGFPVDDVSFEAKKKYDRSTC